MARLVTEPEDLRAPRQVWASAVLSAALVVLLLIVIVIAGLPLWANFLIGAAGVGMLVLGANAAWALLKMRVLGGVSRDVVVEKRPHFAIDLTVTSPRSMAPLDLDDLHDLIDEIPLDGDVGAELTLQSKRVIRVTIRALTAKPLDAAGMALRIELKERGYEVELETVTPSN